MQWDIGLDFGETGVRLATRQKGVALCSPSWGAIRGEEIIAIGDSALDMLGRAPRGVSVEKPVGGGMLDQPRLAAQWISRLVSPFATSRLGRPSLVLSDSGLYRRSERELLAAAAIEVGAQRVGWVPAEILSAIGAGMDVLRPRGQIVVCAGAGVLSAALVAYGRVVHAERLPWGASRVDHDIVHLVRAKAALAVGPRMAEEIKLSLASALPGREMKMQASGLDLTGGFPGKKEVTAAMIQPATEPLVEALATLILCCMDHATPELSADIGEEGAVLTGGGALLSGLDEALRARTGLACRVAEAPEMAVIQGMAQLLASEPLSDLARE